MTLDSARNSLKDLKDKLEQLDSETIATELAYLRKGIMNNREGFHRLSISGSLAKKIAQQTKDRLLQRIKDACSHDDGLIDINSADLTHDSIGYIKVSEFDVGGAAGVEPDTDEQSQASNALFELLSNFPGQTHERVLGSNLAENAPKVSLISTSISLGDNENPSRLISIRRQGGASLLGRKGFLPCIVHEGQLVEVNDVFELKDTTDFFIWDGAIWVFDENSFENSLGFGQLTKSRASKTLEKITTNLQLANADELVNEIKRGKRTLRKVAQLFREGYLNNLNNDNFISYCNEHKIKELIVNANGDIELADHSSHTLNRFLDAVSQNYFTGGIDGGSFKAINKVRRT